jgi:hypothetical protein
MGGNKEKKTGQRNDPDIPSKAYISPPFFQKIVFLSKIFFGKPPSKFLEVRYV